VALKNPKDCPEAVCELFQELLGTAVHRARFSTSANLPQCGTAAHGDLAELAGQEAIPKSAQNRQNVGLQSTNGQTVRKTATSEDKKRTRVP